MKRIRLERPKPRRERRYDPLPLDPRDPDILRAKQLSSVRRPHHERGAVLEVGRDAEARKGEGEPSRRARSHG
jgi:hypothetical protein